MMSPPLCYSKLLSERGISMKDAFGTDDVALFTDDALAAAASLRGTGVAVLGGDVFYKTSQGFELAYANWHSEPKAGEDADAFVARSIQEASEYIRMYTAAPNKIPIFALVVSQVFS